MEQRLSLITLGVTDLVRSRHFYETSFGWQSPSASQMFLYETPPQLPIDGT